MIHRFPPMCNMPRDIQTFILPENSVGVRLAPSGDYCGGSETHYKSVFSAPQMAGWRD